MTLSTYFYSVIESLCRLINSIQQGQRTSLVSVARVINEQNEVIGKYQEVTIEEGLADFFSNPSYRATDPVLQQPVETEEDWGGITPVEVPEQPLTP